MTHTHTQECSRNDDAGSRHDAHMNAPWDRHGPTVTPTHACSRHDKPLRNGRHGLYGLYGLHNFMDFMALIEFIDFIIFDGSTQHSPLCTFCASITFCGSRLWVLPFGRNGAPWDHFGSSQHNPLRTSILFGICRPHRDSVSGTFGSMILSALAALAA